MEENCKLFVGGVSWLMTEEKLSEHFSEYGTVTSVIVAKDRVTGSPRGFAFVSFSDSHAVARALHHQTHHILGRTVDVKRAIPRGEQNHQEVQQSRGLSRNSRSNGRSNEQLRTKKIFVGGLSANLTEGEFRSYFEQFGRITDVVVMHDNVTHRPRGFGFITFDTEDAVEEVMLSSFHELGGKQAEVKRAVPKDGNNDHNLRGGNRRGSNGNNYQNGHFRQYSPRYDSFQNPFRGYGPYGPVVGYGGVVGCPYGPHMFGGGYPTGGYGFVYGMTPLALRNPWTAMVGFRGGPLYANYYPAYMDDGNPGGATNGYNGIMETMSNAKSGEVGGDDDDDSPSQIDGKPSERGIGGELMSTNSS